MHTILRTAPLIASALDDQRYGLGDCACVRRRCRRARVGHSVADWDRAGYPAAPSRLRGRHRDRCANPPAVHPRLRRQHGRPSLLRDRRRRPAGDACDALRAPRVRGPSPPTRSLSKRCATAVAKERWPAARPRSAGGWGSRATDRSLVTGDELHTDTAPGGVGRVALAFVGARTAPTTHASIAERDDIEAGLNDGSRRDRPAREVRDGASHGQVSGSSSSPAP